MSNEEKIELINTTTQNAYAAISDMIKFLDPVQFSKAVDYLRAARSCIDSAVESIDQRIDTYDGEVLTRYD